MRIAQCVAKMTSEPDSQPTDYVKVHMEGEAPWAYRMAERGDELIGRIDNQLVATDLHGYEFNDVVKFKLINGRWIAKEKVTLGVAEKTDTPSKENT